MEVNQRWYSQANIAKELVIREYRFYQARGWVIRQTVSDRLYLYIEADSPIGVWKTLDPLFDNLVMMFLLTILKIKFMS